MLTIESISFSYGKRSALSAISAEAGAGRVVALVGRNGSGKSTLLRLIAGLANPNGGAITWRNTALCRLDAILRARQVAYVAQRPGLAIDLTVSQVIELGRFAAQRRDDGALRLSRAIKTLGLESLSERSFHQLSAGEQQRCVVARALVQSDASGLLALDEPFSNLDPGETMRVVDALRERAREGALVVIAMHDLSLVDRVADCVWWLERGTMVGMGAPEEILTPTRLREVFGCEFTRGAQGLTLGGRVA